jgi:predicted oxidoreductase
VAAAEVADAGKRAIMLDQEPEVSLGGQALATCVTWLPG